MKKNPYIYRILHNHIVKDLDDNIIEERNDKFSIKCGKYYMVLREKQEMKFIFMFKAIRNIDFNTYYVDGFSLCENIVFCKKINVIKITDDCVVSEKSKRDFDLLYNKNIKLFEKQADYNDYKTIRDKINIHPMFSNPFGNKVISYNTEMDEISYCNFALDWNSKAERLLKKSIMALIRRYVGKKVELICTHYDKPFVGYINKINYITGNEQGITFPLITIEGKFKTTDGNITSYFFNAMKEVDYIKVIK